MARIIDGSEMNLIGNNLKKLRQERGWSQQLLSDKLETVAVYICRGSISRIEDKQRFTGWQVSSAFLFRTYLNNASGTDFCIQSCAV